MIRGEICDPLALLTIVFHCRTVPAVFSMLLKIHLPQNSNPIAPTIFSTAYEPLSDHRTDQTKTLSATLLLAAVNSESNVVPYVSIVIARLEGAHWRLLSRNWWLQSD